MTVLTDNEILTQVAIIATTKRNPDYGDNRRAESKGKICNLAAKPSDISSRHDRLLVKKMYELTKLGYLEKVEHFSRFPYFRLTSLGAKGITSAKK